jgi:hypothetical protein
MNCLKCQIREALPGSNYCEIDKPATGPVMRLIDSTFSFHELRRTLVDIESTESVALVRLDAQPDHYTLAFFEPITPGLPVHELNLVKLESGQNRESIIQAQATQGHAFVTGSSVFVGGEITNVLVFRS